MFLRSSINPTVPQFNDFKKFLSGFLDLMATKKSTKTVRNLEKQKCGQTIACLCLSPTCGDHQLLFVFWVGDKGCGLSLHSFFVFWYEILFINLRCYFLTSLQRMNLSIEPSFRSIKTVLLNVDVFKLITWNCLVKPSRKYTLIKNT